MISPDEIIISLHNVLVQRDFMDKVDNLDFSHEIMQTHFSFAARSSPREDT